MVFMANGLTADAAELAPNDGAQNQSERKDEATVKEASDIIDHSDAEVQSSSTNTEGNTTTSTTTYTEETDNATSVTTETTQQTTTPAEELTKDTENVTVTENKETNTITTSGNYIEPVSTTETNSTTTITTSDENLKDEIEEQLKDKSKEENSNIKDISVSENYSINSGSSSDKDNPLNKVEVDQLEEAIGPGRDLKDATFSVESVDGGDTTIKCTINDNEVPLSDSFANDPSYEGVKNKIINSAKTNSVTKIAYINDQKLDEEASSVLSNYLDVTNYNIIVLTDNNSIITYVDSEGKTCTVEDDDLKNTLLKIANDYNIEVKSTKYDNGKTYSSQEAASSDKQAAEADGYKDVDVVETGNTTTETKTFTYTTKEEAEKQKEAMENDASGYINVKDVITIPGNTTGTTIKDFSGLIATTKQEYDRISSLPKEGSFYVETNPDGTKTYYKLDATTETYTLIAKNSTHNMTSFNGAGQHQEGSYIIGNSHTYYKYNTDHHRTDTILDKNEVKEDYTPYTTEMTDILKSDATDVSWAKINDGYRTEKDKLIITSGGTYRVNGTVADTFIRIMTSEKVYVILDNQDTDKTVYVPLVTTFADYQTHQTGNEKNDFGDIYPDITFVTDSTKVEMSSAPGVGNVLAPKATVHFNSGNFCGTIICESIEGSTTEGHLYQHGYKKNLYLYDSRIVTTEAAYMVTGELLTKEYKITGTKEYQDIVLKKATYGETYVDKSYEIKFSEHSQTVTTGTWSEERTIELPPTPPTPPVIPPTPPVDPPTNRIDPPTEQVVIVNNNEEPPAEEVVVQEEVSQVLGAKRSSLPEVLGARRARTSDEAQNPLVASILIFGASAIALGLLASLRKKR